MIELGIVSKIVVIGYYMFQKHSNHTPKNRSALYRWLFLRNEQKSFSVFTVLNYRELKSQLFGMNVMKILWKHH